MTADISNLSNLQASEPLDWDGYADAKESVPPPPKGRYIVRVAEQITLGSTTANFLSAQVDPTIIGPRSEGFQIRFTRISAKPFKRGAATVSQLGDYLRAVYGSQTPRPRTPQEQADAVVATAGRQLEIIGDWEAYDKETKWSLKGMENFPKLADGTHSPWIDVPGSEKRDESTGAIIEAARQVRANFKVDRYVPLAG